MELQATSDVASMDSPPDESTSMEVDSTNKGNKLHLI